MKCGRAGEREGWLSAQRTQTRVIQCQPLTRRESIVLGRCIETRLRHTRPPLRRLITSMVSATQSGRRNQLQFAHLSTCAVAMAATRNNPVVTVRRAAHGYASRCPRLYDGREGPSRYEPDAMAMERAKEQWSDAMLKNATVML